MTPAILNQVPWAAVMPQGPQAILIALSSLMLIMAIWFAILESKRRHDWVPIYAMIGGGLAIVYEALGDILVSVLYPIHGQIGWTTLFGREIPLFIGILYFWYMSVPAIYFLKKLESGLTKAMLWRLYAITLALAIAIEMFGVNLHAWVYYGPQPFVVFGVPLWCPMTYSSFVITISVGLHLMSSYLDKKHHWLIIVGIPIFMSGGHCAAALPTAAAMFSTNNPIWIWLGGAGTIVISFLLIYAVSLIYCSDGPRRATFQTGLKKAGYA